MGSLDRAAPDWASVLMAKSDPVFDCLRALYKAADPPVDIGECWEEIPDNVEGTEFDARDPWYLQHEIDPEEYEKIVREFRRYRRKLFRSQLEFALLNFAPKFKPPKSKKRPFY